MGDANHSAPSGSGRHLSTGKNGAAAEGGWRGNTEAGAERRGRGITYSRS